MDTIIVQRKFPASLLLEERINKALNKQSFSQIENLVSAVFDYQELLWKNGIFDTDFFNICENYLIFENQKITLHDQEALTTDLSIVKETIERELPRINEFLKFLREGNVPQGDLKSDQMIMVMCKEV